MYFYTFFFVNKLTGFCQRTPSISHISQEQIKDIGGVVELECSVQYAQDYPVLWIKVNKNKQVDSLPISTSSSLIVRDSRFSLRYDVSSSTYTLQVCLFQILVFPMKAFINYSLLFTDYQLFLLS